MFDPFDLDLSLSWSFEAGVLLAESQRSFDSARGVSGGVFFLRGEATPSVSLTNSRCEVKDESAESAGASDVGVLGVEEGCEEEVGFERCAAWTGEFVVMLDKGFRPAVCRRVRKGMMLVPDCCRECTEKEAWVSSASRV